MRRKITYSWLAVLLSVVVTVFVTAAMTAHAAQHPSPGPARDCIMRIDPLKPGQTSSTHGQLRCFRTFAAAVYAATKGAVRLPAGDHILTQREDQQATSAKDSTVLSVDYNLQDYGGTTLTWYTSISAGCSNGNSYTAGSMPSGYANWVGSALTYASCHHVPHYELNNFVGSLHPCQCAAMGVMWHETQSEKWDENGWTV